MNREKLEMNGFNGKDIVYIFQYPENYPISPGEYSARIVQRRQDDLSEFYRRFKLSIDTTEKEIGARMIRVFRGVNIFFWDRALEFVEEMEDHPNLRTEDVTITSILEKESWYLLTEPNLPGKES